MEEEKSFHEQVKKELEKLDREQVVWYAWRCALRALPFLAVAGNFNYWKEEERQKHLYAVLFVFDYAAAARAAAYAAARAAARAADAYDATYAVRAVRADAYAAYYAADADAAAYTAARARADFYTIGLDDITVIQQRGGALSTELYGTQWNDFMQALKNEGCGYWAKLIEQFFKDGCVKDKEAQQRRLTVPQEIRDKGAAAVGQYLEVLEASLLKNEQIPFQLDRVAVEDKLGRAPLAKAFVRLLKKDVFDTELGHSFIVHLQGEWGAGKSSFIELVKQELNEKEEHKQALPWVFVEYNAWQNQHICPPWWTLLDQIYRQAQDKKNKNARCGFWLRLAENLRRIIWYTGWQKGVALVFTLVFIALVYMFGSSVLQYLENSGKDLKIPDAAKLLLTLCSLAGMLFSFSKFISTPFFMNTAKDAESFVCRAKDPMSSIKRHYSKLVYDITKYKKQQGKKKKQKRELAIIIDDIDRCNKSYIVELLEGIQTLFKEERVLFIIAGDQKWITAAFANTYGEFAGQDSDKERLGELFLEKAFQLTFRLPMITEGAKEMYWNSILGVSPEARKQAAIQEPATAPGEAKAGPDETPETLLANPENDIASPAFMRRLETEYGMTADDVTNRIIEAKSNKQDKEWKHLLREYADYIYPNPRSIKRLANNYSMNRYTLIAERKDISADKLFRWLVIEDLIPEIKYMSSIKDISEYLNNTMPDAQKREIVEKLLTGEKNKSSDAITLENVREIKGL